MPHAMSSPAHLFAAHARQTEPPAGPVPRRTLSDVEVIADVDAIGGRISRNPMGVRFVWTTKGGRISPRTYATMAEAARALLWATGTRDTVAVCEWWRVSAWLAEALETRGEIVRRTADGVCTWGCTEPDFAPDTSPVVLDIFTHVRGAFAVRRDFGLEQVA